MNADDFPHLKFLPGTAMAYIVPLTFGRARINVTNVDDAYGVHRFW